MNVAEVVVSTLERLGLEVAFGLPGMWSLPIYEAISHSKIKHILMRNEQFAVYASDGFARASGGIGLCIGSAGQGAINLAAGLAAPFKDNSSIVSITSQVPTYEQGKGWIEDVDLITIFSQVTKFCAQINDPYEAYNIVCKAYLSCLEGCPGPSCIIIPGDVQKKPSTTLNYFPIPNKIIPDSESIELVVRELSNSKFPLILAGRGAILSNSSDLMLHFIEVTNIPLVTSMMGRGIVSEYHPLCLGPVGRRGFREANEALSSCDLLLVLGCRLSNMTIGKMGLKCKIIQVDVESRNFSPISNIKIRGDVSAFLELIIKKLNKIRGKVIDKNSSDYIMPYAKAIAKSRDAIFSLDVGQHAIWLLKALRIEHPRQLIFPGGMSSMGFSIPAAIGAKFALPNKKVIAVIGDGGFQMSSSELSTIKENNLAIAICLFNNKSLGLIRQVQSLVYKRIFGVDYEHPPDYLKLAEAYGINAVSARNPEDVSKALEVIKEPILIEIPISKEEGIELTKPRILED